MREHMQTVSSKQAVYLLILLKGFDLGAGLAFGEASPGAFVELLPALPGLMEWSHLPWSLWPWHWVTDHLAPATCMHNMKS